MLIPVTENPDSCKQHMCITSSSGNHDAQVQLKKEKYLQISKILIAPQPLDLRSGITVDDITFFVLEVPGYDNEDIPFTDPDFLFDLSLDSPHPGHAIETTDPDMVCTHHQFSIPE
jgi:hypothetical protein